ncbi:citrate/2-methylcitrate synthase [Deferrisoma camini]|uniref:citrate/2-methylcitrate synthase n=1 Tax=Deferrisoma camini TaxID=1035120 RepID=UPI0004A31F73|nr:citrate/2-methylcitrate synthase [Deferrisoma camini]
MAPEPVCYPRVKNVGLRGITVADTKVSFIDGTQGILIYRGYRIEDLARHSTYEEVAHLLIHGHLPTAAELEAFERRLRTARAVPAEVLESLRLRPATATAMDVLQGAVAFLADHDPDLGGSDPQEVRAQAERLTARLPGVVAAWARIRAGEPVPEPRDDLGHAAHFLHQLTGRVPDPEAARLFDVCLLLHADHTFNASTFAAREVASTRAHLYAAVGAAIGALSGELHGGANTRVMAMLREIGTVDRVEAYVTARLNAGDRVMGMGHAVYKTLDPRARILKEMALGLAERTSDRHWLDIAERVCEVTQREFRARKGAEIYPNVDFYSAPVYHQLGIDPDLFTPVFALGRVAGWCAHVIEEKFAEAQDKPALYRPKAEYVGEYCGPQGCVYEPIEARGRGA